MLSAVNKCLKKNMSYAIVIGSNKATMQYATMTKSNPRPQAIADDVSNFDAKLF